MTPSAASWAPKVCEKLKPDVPDPKLKLTGAGPAAPTAGVVAANENGAGIGLAAADVVGVPNDSAAGVDVAGANFEMPKENVAGFEADSPEAPKGRELGAAFAVGGYAADAGFGAAAPEAPKGSALGAAFAVGG